MATNSLPTNSAQLIGLGHRMHTGIVELGTAIPITMLTAAQLQSALDAFAGLDTGFNAARSARQTASDSYQLTTGAVYDWLLGVSNMLATLFGTRWSAQWAQAGFVNQPRSRSGWDWLPHWWISSRPTLAMKCQR